jgi:Glu-tRNA(Gln) amidotransferase subunit E-like FAD-binding protein
MDKNIIDKLVKFGLITNINVDASKYKDVDDLIAKGVITIPGAKTKIEQLVSTLEDSVKLIEDEVNVITEKIDEINNVIENIVIEDEYSIEDVKSEVVEQIAENTAEEESKTPVKKTTRKKKTE